MVLINYNQVLKIAYNSTNKGHFEKVQSNIFMLRRTGPKTKHNQETI